MSPLSVAAVMKVAQGILPAGHRKLFVKRAPGFQRRILENQDDVSSQLEGVGYHTIEPGQLSLEEQIAAFRGADYVVGVAGAAMTNIAFCHPGTRVVMLAGADFSDTFFWFIATHRHLDYSEIRCEKTINTEFNPNADFRISPVDIEWLKVLDRQEADPQGQIIAHVHSVGDIRAKVGEWVGTPGSGKWIEGFSITPPDACGSIRYRAVLGATWLSPWVVDCSFCGSRGFGLPLLGLSANLVGDAGNGLGLICNATFVDGSHRENVPSDEPCMAESLAPLEAFQIRLGPKQNPGA